VGDVAEAGRQLDLSRSRLYERIGKQGLVRPDPPKGRTAR